MNSKRFLPALMLIFVFASTVFAQPGVLGNKEFAQAGSRQIAEQYDSLFVQYLINSDNKYFISNYLVSLQTEMATELQAKKEEQVRLKKEAHRLSAVEKYIPLGAEGALPRSFDEIDSLAYLWLAEGYTPYSFDNDVVWSRDSAINTLPDSVYIKRLKNIPSVIEMVYNEDSKKWIERYTRRYSVITVQHLVGKAQYYFPMIEEIFDSYNLPLELKYLAIIESALNPTAVSRAGATGLWQFMYSTGKNLGLEINSVVDERCDPVKATHTAAIYLNNLYSIYQDWALALAAYNCGPGTVNRAVRRANGSKNYWEVSKYLPRETQRYVPAFIGVTYVMNYYSEHKISPIKHDLPVFTDTVMLSTPTNFQQVAGVLNISEELVEKLNPQYKKGVIPGSAEHAYALRLPASHTLAFLEHENEIYAYNPKKQKNNPNKNLTAKAYVKKSLDKSTKQKGNYLYYTIQPGDSFWKIARRFKGVTCQDIMKINNMTAKSRINPGDIIKIKRHKG